tara:strand:+ start:3135 stop:3374 length:240 start_codon:yes stop_codon:yes gene_type:complete
MKVRLEVDLELPDVCEKMSEGELQQLLFDVYVGYVSGCHLRDVTSFMAKGMEPSNPVIRMHQTWAEITSNPQWKFKAES